MNEEIWDKIKSITNSNELIKLDNIQELWGSHGMLYRAHLDNKSYILKHIKFPKKNSHPRGWNSNIAQNRKRKSYIVENYWYKNFFPTKELIFPKCLGSIEFSDETIIILEDLCLRNFSVKKSLNPDEIKRTIKWLALFHRKYLDTTPDGLWEIGSYWHLDTRKEELENMSDLKLKEASFKIDKKLNNAKYKTIIHGDAKLANFLYSENEVAALDFQYIGGGVGVKDLAYFLSSIYTDQELTQNEASCLDYYFKILNNKKVEAEWRELYPFAWCDFYRFLQGWAPDHYKINSYTKKMRDEVLKCL